MTKRTPEQIAEDILESEVGFIDALELQDAIDRRAVWALLCLAAKEARA